MQDTADYALDNGGFKHKKTANIRKDDITPHYVDT